MTRKAIGTSGYGGIATAFLLGLALTAATSTMAQGLEGPPPRGEEPAWIPGSGSGQDLATGPAYREAGSGVSPAAIDAELPEASDAPDIVGVGYRSVHFQLSIGGFTGPFHIAVDNDTFFVSDVLGNAVQMYQIAANAATFVRTFGTGTGSAGGQFNGPEQVAIVGNDMFVADYNNNRIQRFNKTTGAFVSQFGVAGSGNGQLSAPAGLIYNPANGFLYVSEVGNDRVQVFTTSGTYQFGFSTLGSANGQVNNPYGLAVDSRGNIYVADSGNNRIGKFTAAGVWVRNIATGVVSPLSVFVDRADVVWTMSGSGDIYAYDWQGGYHTYYYGTAPASGAKEGFFSDIRGIAVTPPLTVAPFNGTPAIIVSDITSTNVQLFSVSAQRTTHTAFAPITGLGSFVGGVAFDSSENIYVTRSTSNLVAKYDKFGTFITSWGTAGTGNGQFNFPYGIAVDDSNNVYVADFDNNRIQKFNSSGGYLLQWGTPGTGNGQFSNPGSIATDGSWLYVTDEGNDRIQKFSFSGGYVRQWGTTGTADGQFDIPSGIAVDRKRNQVYVADFGSDRLQQFTVFGDFIQVFPAAPTALSNPVGVATDQNGNLYVADRSNNRVVQFNDNGTYLATFTSTSANSIGVNPRSNQLYVGSASGGTLNRYGASAGTLDTIGIWRPSTNSYYLRNSNTTGFADISTTILGATATDLPLVGDWNGDGIATVGIYRPSNSSFYLWDRNSGNNMSAPDYFLTLGIAGDTPIAGDWNGDGTTSVGVYRPSNGILYLRNARTTGFADYGMVLGVPGDAGVAGDWNGDGQSSAGVFRPSTIRFYLSDKNTTGPVFGDYTVALGAAGDTPFTGDWVQQGSTGIGVYRPSTGFLYLKYTLTGPFADVGIYYGIAGDVGVGGHWGPLPTVE